MVLNIFTDGASRGNPGKAGIGIAIYRDKELIKEHSEFIGVKTNNEAEYLALIKALQIIKEMKETDLNIFADSEFLVKQMKGEYKVKSENIKPLNQTAMNLLIGLNVKFNWIPREDNLKADTLANLGIDNKKSHSNFLQTKDIEKEKGGKIIKQNFAKEQNLLKVDKAFFGKINCLKIQMNNDDEIYFHIGLLNSKTKEWGWQKVKMSDSELGEIISVLRKDEAKCSFFHSFSDKKTQIWCNKSKDSFSIKIGEVSKNLTSGEFEVLRIILEKCIRSRNFI